MSFKRNAPMGTFAGFVGDGMAKVNVISSEVRKNDPSIIDVVYNVSSKRSAVNVRVVAFEDGQRSFSKVVVPVTYVDGTDANIGDGVSANVDHTISWRVSSDWAVDLAKVKVEVLAVEEGLLPLELMKLPSLEGHPACEFSWNVITESSAFDALLWLYADHDPGITVYEGNVSRVSDGAILAKGEAVFMVPQTYRGSQVVDGRSVTFTEERASAVAYVLGKMGYSILAGDDLAHVNRISRLGLDPVDANTPTVVYASSSTGNGTSVARIYAYKQVD